MFYVQVHEVLGHEADFLIFYRLQKQRGRHYSDRNGILRGFRLPILQFDFELVVSNVFDIRSLNRKSSRTIL